LVANKKRAPVGKKTVTGNSNSRIMLVKTKKKAQLSLLISVHILNAMFYEIYGWKRSYYGSLPVYTLMKPEKIYEVQVLIKRCQSLYL
jgi:hypothetical protein